MKTHLVWGWLAACAAVALAGLQDEAMAQAAAPGPAKVAGKNNPGIFIRKLNGLGPRAISKTPDSGRGKAQARDWVELSVEFDTEPEWVDELTVQFYALCYERKKDEYTLFKGSITHSDIARGKTHLSSMMIRPQALARYGDVCGVAVEVIYKGEIIETRSEGRQAKGGKALPDEWWKNPKLGVKDGYIVNRALTPFAYYSYDDYEPGK
jgi:hypothetical protein